MSVPAAFGAGGSDLQMLRNEFEPVFFSDGAPVPIHKRRIELDDFVAVVANDVSFERSRAAGAFVIFEIAPDVEFADDSAGNERGNGAVDGGAGDGRIAFPRGEQKLFCGKVSGRFVGGAPDGAALLRVA